MGVGLGAAKWAAAVLVVSLVLPAATKQWSDNQQQRQLKTEVTTNLAGAVARATTDGGFLLANRIEDPHSVTGAGWSPPPGFKEAAQNAWAQNIVNGSAPLITMINQRQARGFQVGARAFIRQILQPFG